MDLETARKAYHSKNYEECIEICTLNLDKDDKFKLYLSNCYLDLEKYKECEELFITVPECCYHNYGCLLFDLKKDKESIKYFHKALEYYEKIKDIDNFIIINKNLGSMYFHEKNYNSSLLHYNKSIKLHKIDIELYNCYKQIISLYSGHKEKIKDYIREILDLHLQFYGRDKVYYEYLDMLI